MKNIGESIPFKNIAQLLNILLKHCDRNKTASIDINSLRESEVYTLK